MSKVLKFPYDIQIYSDFCFQIQFRDYKLTDRWSGAAPHICFDITWQFFSNCKSGNVWTLYHVYPSKYSLNFSLLCEKSYIYSCPDSYLSSHFFSWNRLRNFLKKIFMHNKYFRQISRQVNCKNHEYKLYSRDSIIFRINLSGNN